MLDLTNPKSKKLAVLTELLEIENAYKHDNPIDRSVFPPYVILKTMPCKKCGRAKMSEFEKCHLPDLVPMSLGDISWAVRDKIVEMGLWREWQNRIWTLAELKYTKETPEIWIEAGLTVYEKRNK